MTQSYCTVIQAKNGISQDSLSRLNHSLFHVMDPGEIYVGPKDVRNYSVQTSINPRIFEKGGTNLSPSLLTQGMCRTVIIHHVPKGNFESRAIRNYY